MVSAAHTYVPPRVCTYMPCAQETADPQRARSETRVVQSFAQKYCDCHYIRHISTGDETEKIYASSPISLT